ncbi:MAG TPA: hypothetical protein VKS21_01895 [Spirochaetota bacterium]|nr:hypothetical protein [Spirochaetota bacterium]
MDLFDILYPLMIPMGITAYTLLGLTVILGLIKKRSRLRYKLHKICGICALIAGSIHLAIHLYLG